MLVIVPCLCATKLTPALIFCGISVETDVTGSRVISAVARGTKWSLKSRTLPCTAGTLAASCHLGRHVREAARHVAQVARGGEGSVDEIQRNGTWWMILFTDWLTSIWKTLTWTWGVWWAWCCLCWAANAGIGWGTVAKPELLPTRARWVTLWPISPLSPDSWRCWILNHLIIILAVCLAHLASHSQSVSWSQFSNSSGGLRDLNTKDCLSTLSRQTALLVLCLLWRILLSSQWKCCRYTEMRPKSD